MPSLKIKDNIYSVGVLNPLLRVFDIIMATEYGTTYNAYLIKGNEKTALIETVHTHFFDNYIKNISEIIDPKKIDYIILNHCENDHSGSLAKLMQINPDITVIASTAGVKYLRKIANNPLENAMIVKNGDEIDLGGKTLKFINSPLLHWPDSMFTYLPEDKTLFSCDFLGAHFCEPNMFDNAIYHDDQYEAAFEYYYNTIFGPFKSAVLAGLDKIASLDFDTVCTSHGPILQQKIVANIEKYRRWSEVTNHKNSPKEIVIVYVSAYGCTKQLAEIAQAEVEKSGMKCTIFDVIKYDLSLIKEEIEHSDGIMVGSPTINRDALKPIWDVLSVTDAIINRGKPVAVFGSYGWSGEAVPMLCDRVKGLGLKLIGEGFKANLVPNDTECEQMKEYTLKFIEAVN